MKQKCDGRRKKFLTCDKQAHGDEQHCNIESGQKMPPMEAGDFIFKKKEKRTKQ